MRHLKTLKNVLLSALLASSVGAFASAFAANAQQAQVYFENDLNAAGTVSVSVDGAPVLGSVFADTTSNFPLTLAPGTHEVVVTSGSQEVARQSIDVAGAGIYTLALDENTDDMGFSDGYALSLSSGGPVQGE